MRTGNIVIYANVPYEGAAKYLVIGSPIEPAIYKPAYEGMPMDGYNPSKDYLVISLDNVAWNHYVIKEDEVNDWEVIA